MGFPEVTDRGAGFIEMATSHTDSRRQGSSEILEVSLPDIKLRHGEVLSVLSQLGFQGSASSSTFYEYIKSLRKLGIPIKRGSVGFAGRGHAYYSYYHVMELALVLTLRVYYFVPDSLLAEIARFRSVLWRYFRRAYTERKGENGTPIIVRANGHTAIHLKGVFLDLKMNFSGGRLTKFGPPKLLSPFEALTVFARQDIAARAFQPINLSSLAERVISTALEIREQRRD